jgi:lambda family phage portal protein
METVSKLSAFFKDTFALGNPSALIIGPYSQADRYQSQSGGAKWPGGLSDSGTSPIINHTEMRQNARSAYHDSIHARALVDRMADTVVDVGLKVEPNPNTEILGISPEAARDWSDQVGDRFHIWAKSKTITRDETQTFYQLQRLVEITQQRDNDYFVRFFYTNGRQDLINPLQLQMIDANQINGFAFTSTYGFQYHDVLTDGIRRNAAGKEIGYRVYVKNPKGIYEEKEIPAYGPKSKKRIMLHGFSPEYPGQGRGFSRIGHALQEFENLTDFTSAQIKKAILQSSINMYVKPGKEDPASNPFEDIAMHVAGPPPSETGDGSIDIDTSNFLQYVPLPEATITQPGSVGVFNLEKAEDLRPFENTAPSEKFESFVNSFMAYLAASVSMPVEVLKMQFGENYSASRASLILFWRVAEIWRQDLISDFLDPVYESWLSGEIAAGRIVAPGWADPLLRRAWTSNHWYGAPMPNIDPMRTMEADRGYVEMGATDLDRLARDHNGSSGKMNRAKISKQFAEIPDAPWQKKITERVENDNSKKGEDDA